LTKLYKLQVKRADSGSRTGSPGLGTKKTTYYLTVPINNMSMTLRQKAMVADNKLVFEFGESLNYLEAMIVLRESEVLLN